MTRHLFRSRLVLPLLVALGTALVHRPLHAQIDYRNLDEGRPVRTEDAYPVERYAFELVLPYRYEDAADGGRSHVFAPELAYGLLLDFMVGAKVPLVALDESDVAVRGLGAPRLFGLYNFNTEARDFPALSLRADVDLPAGDLGGDAVRVGVTGIVTRSWGRTRAHLNGTLGLGPDADGVGAAHGVPEWSASLAVDRTLLRRSLLLIGDLGVRRSAAAAPTEVSAALGARLQLTPTMVLDAGLERRLTRRAGADLGLTVGLSHAFSRAAPVTPSRPTARHRRAEQAYHPGGFNWQFLKSYPEAARLFNAFDYGHAVLYERLLTHDAAAAVPALDRQYRYLTEDLLVRPPRFAVAEEAVMPAYAKLAWQAKQMFDWAHVLHRQIYDAYSDAGRTPAQRDSLIERLTDYYLSRPGLAFSTVPKSMALMDGQPFSGAFRREHPKFNGLIWAYHWLQVGLYEPLIAGTSAADRRPHLQATVARFREMVETERYPTAMPMTSAIAPEFSRRHPRAAVIFDNLHMMHDIISDVLASPSIPPARKRAAIHAQLAEFRNPSTNVVSMQEWHDMADHMGGIDAMGGLPSRAGQPRD